MSESSSSLKPAGRKPWLPWALGIGAAVLLLLCVCLVAAGLLWGDDLAAGLFPSRTPTLGIGSLWQRPVDGMTMVYVPAGQFTMGMAAEDALAICLGLSLRCDQFLFTDAEPVHTVYLDAYWIDSTEVTNGMYALCVAAGECDPPDNSSSDTRSSYYGNASYENYPVIWVSWFDAQDYCRWAGAQLPSEAQWEKAARGTDGRVYPWGNESPTCDLANFTGCEVDTVEVGSYPTGVSPYGAYDLAGNVWELTEDWYGENYYEMSPTSNPTGSPSGEFRVLRGGSWFEDEVTLRSSLRGRFSPVFTFYNAGFRCSRGTSP